MIVPMKKVSLVVMDKSREASLEQLRELGIVHLEKKTVQSDALTKLLERRVRAEAALGLLRTYAAPKGKSASAGGAEDPSGQSPDLIARVLALGDEKKNLQEQLVFQHKERSRIETWGDFDPKALGEFAEQGVLLIPYELPLKDYVSLPEDIPLLVLGKDKTTVRFFAVGKEIPGESPWILPERSLSETDARIADIEKKLEETENRFRDLALRGDLIEAEQERLRDLIEFETAKAGLEPVADLPAGLTVSWFSGFVPADELGVLKRAASENGWALTADDPGDEDQVPTKLKNNKIAGLIRPLTDFLEVVPGYNEIDISGFFLFFFVIFFGMIFGDAGYGALILLICLFGISKTAKKGVPPVLKLFLLLGLSNFTWGLLTCSWFGLKVAQIPAVLQNLSLPLISNVRAERSTFDQAIVQQNLMIFCFSLALLQLSIGHILALVHDKSLKVLGHIGSIAMLGGMYFIILSLIASNEARQIPMYPMAVYVFAGGFALNFVFASYEGSIGRSILESLKNIISVILGIANVFSDIMSYIRLWAVGLAGAAIADTVDTMAFQIGGTAGPVVIRFTVFVFAMVLLVFGHGLNLVLNVLSVLVHGVRLNTLEFSGHVGLTWAGTAYKPFAKRAVRSRE
jgi:V/A-type H+-transporting ATPase subunit I